MSLERTLDRALSNGRAADDTEIAALVAVARELERSLAVDPASFARGRAMFVAGVGSRRTTTKWFRWFVPALAMSLVVAVGYLGRVALPGDGLYPVRQFLNFVGLATSPWQSVDNEIDAGARLVGGAETALALEDLAVAEERAHQAIAHLDDALEQLEEFGGSADKVSRVLQVTALLDRAEEVIAAVESAEDRTDPSDRGPIPGRRDDDEDDEDVDDEGDEDDDTDADDANDDNTDGGGGETGGGDDETGGDGELDGDRNGDEPDDGDDPDIDEPTGGGGDDGSGGPGSAGSGGEDGADPDAGDELYSEELEED